MVVSMHDLLRVLADTTYLSPDLRLVCFLGMRFAGVRHVYRRVPRDKPRPNPDSSKETHSKVVLPQAGTEETLPPPVD
jgi:hypothetical protein